MKELMENTTANHKLFKVGPQRSIQSSFQQSRWSLFMFLFLFCFSRKELKLFKYLCKKLHILHV